MVLCGFTVPVFTGRSMSSTKVFHARLGAVLVAIRHFDLLANLHALDAAIAEQNIVAVAHKPALALVKDVAPLFPHRVPPYDVSFGSVGRFCVTPGSQFSRAENFGHMAMVTIQFDAVPHVSLFLIL
jgi:hypothetical protein